MIPFFFTKHWIHKYICNIKAFTLIRINTILIKDRKLINDRHIGTLIHKDTLHIYTRRKFFYKASFLIKTSSFSVKFEFQLNILNIICDFLQLYSLHFKNSFWRQRVPKNVHFTFLQLVLSVTDYFKPGVFFGKRSFSFIVVSMSLLQGQFFTCIVKILRIFVFGGVHKFFPPCYNF